MTRSLRRRMTLAEYMAWGSTVLTILLVDGDFSIFLGCIYPFYNLNCIGGGAGLEGRYWKMAVFHET